MALRNPKDTEAAKRHFLADVDNVALSPTNDLKKLTLDELADRAESIAKQSNEMIAQILVEARRRLNKPEYTAWVQSIPCIAAYSPQYRSKLLRYGRFAESHKMLGISMAAGLQITAKVNEDVADEVYKYCYRKNMSVDDVNRYIEQCKAVLHIDKPKDLPAIESSEPKEPTEKVTVNVIKNVAQITGTMQAVVTEKNIHIPTVDRNELDELDDDEYIKHVPEKIWNEDDFVNAIAAYAMSINMSDLTGIKVYKQLMEQASKRLYKR